MKEFENINNVIVIITRLDTKIDKRRRSKKNCCDKDEKCKETGSGTQSSTKKFGCPFKIMSTSPKDAYVWKINVKKRFHSHNLPDRLEGHSFVGRLMTCHYAK